MRENQLKWLQHVQWRAICLLVRISNKTVVNRVKRIRNRPKEHGWKQLKKDIKVGNLTIVMTFNQA